MKHASGPEHAIVFSVRANGRRPTVSSARAKGSEKRVNVVIKMRKLKVVKLKNKFKFMARKHKNVIKQNVNYRDK